MGRGYAARLSLSDVSLLSTYSLVSSTDILSNAYQYIIYYNIMATLKGGDHIVTFTIDFNVTICLSRFCYYTVGTLM